LITILFAERAASKNQLPSGCQAARIVRETLRIWLLFGSCLAAAPVAPMAPMALCPISETWR